MLASIASRSARSCFALASSAPGTTVVDTYAARSACTSRSVLDGASLSSPPVADKKPPPLDHFVPLFRCPSLPPARLKRCRPCPAPRPSTVELPRAPLLTSEACRASSALHPTSAQSNFSRMGPWLFPRTIQDRAVCGLRSCAEKWETIEFWMGGSFRGYYANARVGEVIPTNVPDSGRTAPLLLLAGAVVLCFAARCHLQTTPNKAPCP